MMSDCIELSSCLLCGSGRGEVVFSLKPTPPADAYLPAASKGETQAVYPLDLWFCHDCHHLHLKHVVNPQLLFSNYIYTSSSSPGLQRHFQAYAEDLLSRFPDLPGKRALDIGSNDGTLLKILKDKRLIVQGVDPAKKIAEKATLEGVPTECAFFNLMVADQLNERCGKFHLVTANNVFAHSKELPLMAEGIRRLLAPDGVFAFEVSNLREMIQKNVFDWIYHEHLSYHSVECIQQFLNRHDLELFDLEPVVTKGGSFRGFAQIRGASRPITDRVKKEIQEDLDFGLDRPERYKSFFQEIEQAKQATREIVLQARREGRRIAGYGASATVTTLIHHFELGEELEFLVDDEPSRQGLLSPGYQLPIRSREALYSESIDDLIILAWRFSSPILEKNKQFLKQGKRVIIPLPEFKLLSTHANHD